jgi:predicted dehydrogenase
MSTRLALIGAGAIAGAYADVVTGVDELAAIAVADPRAEAAVELAQRIGCVAFDRPEDVLQLAPDAVVLCTPPVTHPPLAEYFLDQGVAVLCEKPLAVDGDTAAAMVATAERVGVLLGMATKFRFCTDVAVARAMLHEGRIGRLRLAEVSFTADVDMARRWNSDPDVSGGGVVIDNGTHAVDLVRFVAGTISEVLAVEHARPPGSAVEHTAVLHLRAADADATVDLSWSIDKSLPDFVRLYGTEGEIRVGWRASAWRERGHDWRRIGAGYDKLPAMRGALAQFCRAVRAYEPLTVPAADAVAAARVVDACYASMRHGGWVKVADPL